MHEILIESAVDSVDAALAAERAGADRIELCANLAEGGTTPSAGAVGVACERLGIPVFVMIRPRGGDFLYSAAELEIMLRDIATARSLGAQGVVAGALRRDGTVHTGRMRTLVEAAHPLPVTFHRAFDLTRDLGESLDALIACGVARVLTSGGAARAAQAIDPIASLVARAEGRIVIMPGGGIDAASARELVEHTGVQELHVGGARPVPSAMEFRRPLSFARAPMPDEYTLAELDVARLDAVVKAVR